MQVNDSMGLWDGSGSSTTKEKMAKTQITTKPLELFGRVAF